MAFFKRWRRRTGHDLTADARALVEHLRRQFPGRTVDVEPAPHRRVYQRLPTFHIIVVKPTQPEDGWLYVTSGCWQATQTHGHGLEFVVWAPHDNPEHGCGVG